MRERGTMINPSSFGSKDLKKTLFALIMLAGSYVYYKYNVFFSLAAVFLPVLFLFYSNGFFNLPQDAGRDPNPAYKFLAAMTILLVIMHFYRPFFPQEPTGDEMHDIIGAHMFLGGERGFFHYNIGDGSSIRFVHKALMELFIAVTGGIDNLRILPHIFFVLSCIVFYFLGREIGGKGLGAAMSFVFSAASFTYYLSRMLFSHYLIALFIPLTALLFLLYVRKKNIIYLIFAGILYFLGFFTYVAWFILVPYWVLALVIFRKEMNKLHFTASILFVALASAAVFLFFIHNPGTIDYAFGKSSGGVFGLSHIFQTFGKAGLSLPVLFMKPLDSPSSNFLFSRNLPLFSFAEFILFTGGAVIILKYRRTKINMLFIWGLCFSCATFFVMDPLSYQLRHIVFLIFAVIISAFALEYLSRTDVFRIFIIFYLSFSAWTLVDMQLDTLSGNTGKEAADFIKSEYKGQKYLFVHDAIPGGFYETALRLDQYHYGKDGSFDKVIFLSDIFAREIIKAHFNGSVRKIFYFNEGTGRLPLVLYEIPVSAGDENYFKTMKSAFSRINLLMWDHGYTEASEECGRLEIKYPAGSRDLFFNTLLRLINLEASYKMYFLGTGGAGNLYNLYYKNLDRLYPVADFYYYRGKTAMIMHDYAGAKESFAVAAKMAGWWAAPKEKLSEINPMFHGY